MSTNGISGASAPIEAALRRAASATGVDFGFLMRTAHRESGFNAGAKAPSSSAAGLFQFVDQTWLATLKRHGSAHGFGGYADLIEEGADGRFRVRDQDAKQAVMALRYDAHAASIMAGELATEHAAYLRGRIGREPTGGELYAAHFLGPAGAARLVEAMQGNPQASAAAVFPDAAGANAGVFYRDGRAVSVAELYANLSATGDGGAAGGQTPTTVGPAPDQPAFARYARAGRGDRDMQEAMLVDMLLNSSGRESPMSSMFSSEMLALFTQARNDAG